MNQNLPIQTTGLKVTFKSLFDFSGKTLAVVCSFKDFELSEPESDTLAEQTDQVLIEFFPNIQNRWVKLGALVVSLLGIFGKKYFSYEKEKDKKIREVEKTTENHKEQNNKNIVVSTLLDNF